MAATTERWQRLESLFEQAIALPPAERRRFVDQHCGPDEDLRRRLQNMLASDDDPGVLDHGALPASGIASVEPGLSLIGRRVADFQVVRVIAAGGMGTVYEAQQEHPPRRVALKVLGSALASPDAVRRFEFEAEILARLQHPAIAAIHESGVFNDDAAGHGRPFFAMELVNGRPLTHFADHERLDRRQRVELLIKVCEGVEHAHSRGVIHRDLKPANILVLTPGRDEETERRGDGVDGETASTHTSSLRLSASPSLGPSLIQPKILDFGIARLVDAQRQATVAAARTMAGQILGTLAYMSPEQVDGSPDRIDIRSDVYALGVIAYELLGGRTPHDLTTVSVAQAARVIAEREPPALGTLARDCRGDLETIVRQALEKDPDRRYQSVAHLGEDLRRYLRDEPIAARRASRLYQLKKFARRNRVLVGGMCAVLAALALGVIATSWQWRQAITQRDAADTARTRAEQAERLARQRLEEAMRDASAMLDIADTELAGLPGGSRPRESMALAALDRMQRSAAGADMDPATRNLLGYAHQRVGEAQLALGRTRLALASQQRALDIRLALAAERPDIVDYPRTLAVGHWKIAEPLLAMGRIDEVTSHHRAALRLLEEIAARDKDSEINMLVYPGLAWRRLGESELIVGRAHESIEGFERAFELFDRVLTIEPEQLTVLRTRSTALRTYGEALLSAGKPDAALQALHESLKQAQSLLARMGNVNVFESMAACRTHASLAQMLADRDQAEEARRHMAASLDQAQRLAAADPASFDALHLQAWCWMQEALVAQRLGENSDAARAKYERAVEALLHVADLDPDNARVRVDALRACERLVELTPPDLAESWRTKAASLREHPGVRELARLR